MVQVPFAPAFLIIVFVMLLHSNIGEVYHRIGQVGRVHRKAYMREARKPTTIHIDRERLVASDKHIQAQVELLAADEQGIRKIPLDHVGLCVFLLFLILVYAPLPGILIVLAKPLWILPPGRNITELVKEEDALPLRLAYGLHDPDRTVGLLALELLHKHRVLRRKHEGRGVACSKGLGIFVQTISLRLPLSSLQVLHHQILPSKLVMVAEVVHLLLRLQMDVVEHVVDPLLVAPEKIPIKFGLSLLEAARLQDIVDRVVKGTPEPHVLPRRALALRTHIFPEEVRHAFGLEGPSTNRRMSKLLQPA
mmetsp:Transcript_76645/g.164365  ORF Transcript_76645/g.164365 Transcript_76645/m.164365 type:complete len:307 (-) Transcript_76645:31-951(-)